MLLDLGVFWGDRGPDKYAANYLVFPHLTMKFDGKKMYKQWDLCRFTGVAVCHRPSSYPAKYIIAILGGDILTE